MSGRLRVAVVGSGPAGFYAAERLLATAGAEVEMLDRLPTPWGLVRAGVAPDHPKIKSVTRVYEKVAEQDGFRFHGGVHVGETISHAELLAHHHAVIYAHGADRDRRLGIPGEDLPGSHAATDFVAWYNGHPDATEAQFELVGRRAVVVGNGNVALDVARMLVLDRGLLATTDIADHALEALRESTIEEVVVLGRRGPVEAAYTLPELRELGALDGVDVVVEGEVPEPAGLEGPALRSLEVLRSYRERAPRGAPRRIVLRFLASPVAVLGDERVTGLRVVRNELIVSDGGAVRAQPTGEEDVIACDLVLRSIGYRGRGIEGVPFDDRSGTIPNREGRVAPGVYVAGWIKRGPEGVIGTNKRCAHETVAALLADHEAGRHPAPAAGARAFDRLLAERTALRVDYDGWRRIDLHERSAGSAQGRPRVKLTRRDELHARAVLV